MSNKNGQKISKYKGWVDVGCGVRLVLCMLGKYTTSTKYLSLMSFLKGF